MDIKTAEKAAKLLAGIKELTDNIKELSIIHPTSIKITGRENNVSVTRHEHAVHKSKLIIVQGVILDIYQKELKRLQTELQNLNSNESIH